MKFSVQQWLPETWLTLTVLVWSGHDVILSASVPSLLSSSHGVISVDVCTCMYAAESFIATSDTVAVTKWCIATLSILSTMQMSRAVSSLFESLLSLALLCLCARACHCRPCEGRVSNYWTTKSCHGACNIITEHVRCQSDNSRDHWC